MHKMFHKDDINMISTLITKGGAIAYIIYVLLENPERIFCFSAYEVAFVMAIFFTVLEYVSKTTKRE